MTNCGSKTKCQEISSTFKLESDAAWRQQRNDLDTVGAVKPADHSLPQIFLAVLGAADWLQHVVELCHAARNHTERIASAADDTHKVVIVRRRDVMQPSLCAHVKPVQRCIIILLGFCLICLLSVSQICSIKIFAKPLTKWDFYGQDTVLDIQPTVWKQWRQRETFHSISDITAPQCDRGMCKQLAQSRHIIQEWLGAELVASWLQVPHPTTYHHATYINFQQYCYVLYLRYAWIISIASHLNNDPIYYHI